jgi:FemAB-related protein (PEP-CTERM system-associated)
MSHSIREGAAPTIEQPGAQWDHFARRQPGFTHFHLHGWLDLVGEVFGHRCFPLEQRDTEGRLQGVLPLVRVKSAVFGHYLVSMPFLNYGGPLGTDAAVRHLSARAVELAATSGAKLLELRSRVPLPLDLPVSHRKITVLLDLPESAEALMKALPAKLRSQVRRPQKEGVTMRFGPDQVIPFFQVFSHHMRDLGTPTLPLRFFQAIATHFPESSWFGCAWLNEQPIACGAGFAWEGEFEMTWASSLVAYNRIAPNMLVYWSFMERAIQSGLKVFNFGRCTPDSGTHRFKRQWGSRDAPLYWYQRTRDGEPASTPSPDSGAFSWGPRLWKRLPLPLATLLGPRIVRYIP